MKAVIMAGGEGTRLRPLTCTRPKPMVPVLNRPMMEHIVELLKLHNFTKIASTLWYMPEDVIDYFQDGSDFGVSMEYYVEREPLGTAGSVKNAGQFLDQTFVVVSGDALTDIDLSAAMEFHQKKGSLATLILTPVPNPLNYGVVLTDGEERITQFLEKPSWDQVFSDTVNTGIYILEPEVLNLVHPGKKVDFSQDIFPELLRRGAPLYGYVASGYWSDIGSLEAYRQAQRDSLDGKVKLNLPLPQEGNIYQEEGVQVHSEAKLEGPIYLGKGVRIEAQAHIGPYTVLGSHSHIGQGASVRQATLWPGVRVGAHTELRGCVCAKKAEVGAESKVYEGAVLGEKVRLGAMAMLAPRVKVWPEKMVPSGTHLRNSLVWGSQEQGPLFSKHGIAGDFRGNLTPEILTQLGLCYANLLGSGKTVLFTRDHSKVTELASEALVLGLRAGGLHVVNGREVAGNLTRFAVQYLKLDGAFHLSGRISEPNWVSLTYWDRRGRLLSKAEQRKVEGLFEREDYPRLEADDFGTLTESEALTPPYLEFLARVYPSRHKDFRIGLIDKSQSSFGEMIKQFLELSGYQVVQTTNEGLPTIVAEADSWFFQDEDGNRLSNHGWWRVFMGSLKARKIKEVAVPIHLSQEVAQEAKDQGLKLQWTKMEPLFWMEVAGDLGNSVVEQGVEVFPQLEPLASMGEILHFLSGSERQLNSWQFQSHLKEGRVPCPWDEKGRIMRALLERFNSENSLFLDGIKEQGEGQWALIVPDGDDPIFKLYSEAQTDQEADQLIKHYAQIIEAYQNEER